jgi:hypothetical protein
MFFNERRILMEIINQETVKRLKIGDTLLTKTKRMLRLFHTKCPIEFKVRCIEDEQCSSESCYLHSGNLFHKRYPKCKFKKKAVLECYHELDGRMPRWDIRTCLIDEWMKKGKKK